MFTARCCDFKFMYTEKAIWEQFPDVKVITLAGFKTIVDKIERVDMLGNIIFEMYDHFCTHMNEERRQWFLLAFKRLVVLTKKELADYGEVDDIEYVNSLPESIVAYMPGDIAVIKDYKEKYYVIDIKDDKLDLREGPPYDMICGIRKCNKGVNIDDKTNDKIYQQFYTHICPVCNKYFFSLMDDRETCPECGWRNDENQKLNPTEHAGANSFCLNEAKLYYGLIHNRKTKIDTINLRYEFDAKVDKIVCDHGGYLDNEGEQMYMDEQYEYIGELANLYWQNFGDKSQEDCTGCLNDIWEGKGVYVPIDENVDKKLVKDFIDEWLPLFEDETTDYYKLSDDPSFGIGMLAMGFKMDCGHCFSAIYGNKIFDGYENLEKVIAGKVTDVDILGSAILSHWRYFNHWADVAEPQIDAPKNRRWFILALRRLRELVN